ncbi:hypothetical protein Leryth_026737 [Lithospermum erythrorhizon]|nr:hypothetical protein Leryth_026737 [Lithospermum erythrorhizon]
MQSNDFEGARKIAMKAQQLFPELENISQLLTVCSVHCADQNKILGSEKDFYGILQLEKFADEVAIKKQYRKLALTLHPDKNKLPGAEAAFKLIGEANTVLLDAGKKAAYDSKCKVAFRTAQAKQPSYQFCSLNRNQKTTSNTSVPLETFWTACPYCHTNFQYLKKFVNHVLPCQNCNKTFTTYESGIQGASFTVNSGNPTNSVPPGKAGADGMSTSQPPTQGIPPNASRYKAQVFLPKGIPHTGSSRTNVPNTKTGLKRNENNNTARSKSGCYTDGGRGKSDIRDGYDVSSVKRDKHRARESGAGNNGKKRKRKHVVESSESCDTSSSNGSDEYVIEEHGGIYTAGLDSGGDSVRCTRRSFRHRQNVSYKENGSDDDLENPPRKSDPSKSFGDNEEAVSNNASKSSCTSAVDINNIGHVPGDDSKSDLNPDSTTEQTVQFDIPDPEFTDFDKEKEKHCFAANQVWALYDTIDGMPRFYALIKKVFKTGFKLKINWLEGDPEEENEIAWVNQELPFGCGKFQLGNSETTTDRLSFSHQVQYGEGMNGNSVVIRPHKGEIWALFKDWDIMWSSNPEKHKKFKYEIVEVVSDFLEEAGIRVSYLEKVKGFVCLFQRASTHEMGQLIPPNEMLRFSNKIPFAKMTGTEKVGVTAGSYELDPASLPLDLLG